MTETLQMIFLNAAGKKVTISVSDPREDLVQADVQAAMSGILAGNVIITEGGDLTAIDSARIVTRNVTELI